MNPPMTTEGLSVLCVANTYMNAVVDDFAVVKLRYVAGPGVPTVSEACACPVATTNLFDHSSSFTFD